MAAGGRFSGSARGLAPKVGAFEEDSVADSSEHPFAHGETAPMRGGGGRRYSGQETNLIMAGTSAAGPWRQGRGRRSFVEEDRNVIPQDHHRPVEVASNAPPPRRAFHNSDSIKEQVFGGGGGAAKSPLGGGDPGQEMKDAIVRCLAQEHNIEVYEEERWAAVIVERSGCTWKLEALTEQGLSICREGRSTKTIAEKLSMFGGQELKHFGVRFGGKAASAGDGEREPWPSARDAAGERELRPSARGAVGERELRPSTARGAAPPRESSTYASHGVHTALCTPRSPDGPQQSCSRRDPEDRRVRYISSGRDHFETSQVGSHGELGAHGDIGFCDGLARGIGHGRRQVSTARQGNFAVGRTF